MFEKVELSISRMRSNETRVSWGSVPLPVDGYFKLVQTRLSSSAELGSSSWVTTDQSFVMPIEPGVGMELVLIVFDGKNVELARSKPFMICTCHLLFTLPCLSEVGHGLSCRPMLTPLQQGTSSVYQQC